MAIEFPIDYVQDNVIAAESKLVERLRGIKNEMIAIQTEQAALNAVVLAHPALPATTSTWVETMHTMAQSAVVTNFVDGLENNLPTKIGT